MLLLIGLILKFLSGRSEIALSIVTIVGAMGVSWKGVGNTLTRAIGLVDGPVWRVEVGQSVNEAATVAWPCGPTRRTSRLYRWWLALRGWRPLGALLAVLAAAALAVAALALFTDGSRGTLVILALGLLALLAVLTIPKQPARIVAATSVPVVVSLALMAQNPNYALWDHLFDANGNLEIPITFGTPPSADVANHIAHIDALTTKVRRNVRGGPPPAPE